MPNASKIFPSASEVSHENAKSLLQINKRVSVGASRGSFPTTSSTSPACPPHTPSKCLYHFTLNRISIHDKNINFTFSIAYSDHRRHSIHYMSDSCGTEDCFPVQSGHATVYLGRLSPIPAPRSFNLTLEKSTHCHSLKEQKGYFQPPKYDCISE